MAKPAGVGQRVDRRQAGLRGGQWQAVWSQATELPADLLDNTLMNWAHLLDAGAKNRAAKASIEAAETMGAAELVDGPAGKESGQSKPSIFVVQVKNGKVALPW